MRRDIVYIENDISDILHTFAEILRGREKATAETAGRLTGLRQHLISGKENACKFENNNLLPHAKYYVNYISMRQTEGLIIYNIYKYIQKIKKLDESTYSLADYIDAIGHGIAMIRGYVMQEQPFSVNDGEGIRTTIFLAGCPMRCRWCSNPEGFGQKPLVGYYVKQCIGCGRCAEVCPQGIGIDLNDPAMRKKCTGCGKCAAACPKSARRQLVSVRDADEIIAAAKKFSMFYRASGGGITFSGGEATFQPELLNYLSEQLYDMGFSLDLET